MQENPSEKDINQGTLVVFNVDALVSSDALLQIFGAHGEIKEVGNQNSVMCLLLMATILTESDRQ